MKKELLEKLAEGSLVDLLNAAFQPDFGQGWPEKRQPVEDGETRRGTVNSPIARSLYLASDLVLDRVVELNEAHCALHHPTGQEAESHDCKAFLAKAGPMKERADILRQLAWAAIAEEYPVLLSGDNNAILRAEWTLVTAVDEEWESGVHLDLKPGTVISTLTSRLQAIFIDQKLEDPLVKLPPMESGSKEVGVIKDLRIKVLHGLHKMLEAEAVSHEPPNPEKDPKAFVAWMMERSMQDLMLKQNLMGLYAARADSLKKVFWRAIKDEIPDLPHGSAKVSDGWKVAVSPTSRHAAMVEIVIVSNGLPSTGFLFPSKHSPVGRG